MKNFNVCEPLFYGDVMRYFHSNFVVFCNVQVFATSSDDIQLKTCSFGVCINAINYDKHISIMICIMHKAHVLPYLQVDYMRSLKFMIMPKVKVLGKKTYESVVFA